MLRDPKDIYIEEYEKLLEDGTPEPQAADMAYDRTAERFRDLVDRIGDEQ